MSGTVPAIPSDMPALVMRVRLSTVSVAPNGNLQLQALPVLGSPENEELAILAGHVELTSAMAVGSEARSLFFPGQEMLVSFNPVASWVPPTPTQIETNPDPAAVPVVPV